MSAIFPIRVFCIKISEEVTLESGVMMPEMPEVETVRRGLEEIVIGKTVASVTVTWPRIVQAEGGLEAFEKRMPGQQLMKVGRIGKFLLFYWTDVTWIAHLRMEGKYLYEKQDTPVDPYTHVICHLTDGNDLRYRDVRKFGRIHMVDKADTDAAIAQLKLGPEPADLNFDDFKAKLMRTKRPIKAVLLDQSVVAGIGNIYADEILYKAKVHPQQSGSSLYDNEITAIIESSRDIIQAAIAVGGTTIRTYTNTFGENGHFANYLKAYGQTGKPCQRCGTPIEKIKVAQRGTHFCPYCQKIHKN